MPEMKHLKTKSEYLYHSPTPDILDTFPNPGVNWVELECTEVTSLCPKTGQPDLERVLVHYTPGALCLESKSLKLYLGAFRQEGLFGEAMAKRICDDLAEVLQPISLEVRFKAKPRGGISIGCIARYSRYSGSGSSSRPPLVDPLREG